MLQTIFDALVAHAPRDERRVRLQHRRVIAHRHAVTDRPEHGQVVFAVAKGIGAFDRQMEMLYDRLHADRLVKAAHGHIGAVRRALAGKDQLAEFLAQRPDLIVIVIEHAERRTVSSL